MTTELFFFTRIGEDGGRQEEGSDNNFFFLRLWGRHERSLIACCGADGAISSQSRRQPSGEHELTSTACLSLHPRRSLFT